LHGGKDWVAIAASVQVEREFVVYDEMGMLLKHNIDGATVRTGKWTGRRRQQTEDIGTKPVAGTELPRWFRSHKKQCA
jgi:hypothetical protein